MNVSQRDSISPRLERETSCALVGGQVLTESEYDPMENAARHGIEDADPEEFYRHCEHLHLAYNPSHLGKMTGVVSIGTKTLWCKHGGGMEGPSLTRMFSAFKDEYCDGCEHHCPRPDDWELTNEFAEQQVNDTEFQEFLKARNSALTPPEYDESDQ